MSSIQQVILLAGGKGTRMREMTEDLPKPMVEIGGIPVLEHLINIFNRYGKFKYLICTGYLESIIFDYFDGWNNVEVLSTGDETNTGGRINNIKSEIEKGDSFMLTYGDGLSNVDISKLIKFHKKIKHYQNFGLQKYLWIQYITFYLRLILGQFCKQKQFLCFAKN